MGRTGVARAGASLRPLQLRPAQPLGQDADDGLVRCLELTHGDEDWSAAEELRFPSIPPRVFSAKKALLGTGTLMVVLLLVGSLTLRQRNNSFGPEQAIPSQPAAPPPASLPREEPPAPARGRAPPPQRVASHEHVGGMPKPVIGARDRASRLRIHRVHVEQIFTHLHMVVNRLQNSTRQCDEAEELFKDLCYKKCSLLTGGQFPIRVAPDSCRRVTTTSDEAGLNEVSMRSGNCSGYAVGAKRLCPHEPLPSVCDDNEENYLGFCYKKCHHLTSGEHPVRRGANVCCTEEPCMNVSRLKFNGVGCTGFGVGGGRDGHHCAHLPDRRPTFGTKTHGK